jgi:hypothetical protein
MTAHAIDTNVDEEKINADIAYPLIAQSTTGI